VATHSAFSPHLSQGFILNATASALQFLSDEIRSRQTTSRSYFRLRRPLVCAGNRVAADILEPWLRENGNAGEVRCDSRQIEKGRANRRRGPIPA
jgi:hypothetical protein